MRLKGKQLLVRFIAVNAFALLAVKSQGQLISAEQNYAINSPGVVIVQTVFSATVYVNKVEMNESKFRQLVDSVKRLDTTGALLSAQEKLDIVVKALYNNPVRYLVGTNEYFRQRHRIISSGTGFFITGDGYLITNCHIIDRDSSYIRQQFILSTFQEVTDTHIRSLQSSWAMTLNDEQRNLLSNAYGVIYSQVSSMILFDLKREIYVLSKTGGGNDQVAPKRIPAKVIIKGKAMPGKDIAILKISNLHELPTLSVSTDSSVRIGEQVLVYGYPEPVTSNIFLAKETNAEPTLTSGIIGAIKKSVGGWPVIQMDAVITHGSSGSPVCDNKGKVIGLATFGTIEQNTGGLATAYNFAIPVSVIKEYLDSANILPQTSKASVAYNEGLDLFYKQFYYKAKRKFEGVRKLNPDYPELSYYMQESRKKIDSGEDRDSFLKNMVFRIIAIVLIVGGLFIFYKWQRNKTMKIWN